MLVTKGIIKSIDYASNTYNVNIPLFEGVNNDFPVTLPAIAAVPPGVFNGYNVNDVVIITFEDNSIAKPVIVGKLYLGASQEKTEMRGAISCASLRVGSSCELPLSTKIAYTQGGNDVVAAETSYSKYKTIEDVLKALNSLSATPASNGQCPQTVYCVGPHINIASDKADGYDSEEDKADSCYLITYNGSKYLTADQVKGYMTYMTGYSGLPIKETGKPPITLVTMTGQIYYLN